MTARLLLIPGKCAVIDRAYSRFSMSFATPSTHKGKREQASGRAKGLMFFYLGCSAYDQAAEYLEELIEARDPDVIWLGCHPFLRDPQQDPRLGVLLSQINLR